MKIPVAIVDDRSQNRISLREQLNYAPDIDVLFTADNGADFLDKMKKASVLPKVVLMDIEMPEMDGIKAVSHGHLLYPDAKFLMLTVFDDDDKIFEAIKAGASGYLLKDEKIALIARHIKDLVEIGGVAMSPRIARKAMDLLMKASLPEKEAKQAEEKEDYNLSKRESEILALLIDGQDTKDISQKLFISVHTVRKHIANIYEKLHISSRVQILRLAGKMNL